MQCIRTITLAFVILHFVGVCVGRGGGERVILIFCLELIMKSKRGFSWIDEGGTVFSVLSLSIHQCLSVHWCIHSAIVRLSVHPDLACPSRNFIMGGQI